MTRKSNVLKFGWSPKPSLFAYRGYTVVKGLTGAEWYISKDGYHIATAMSEQEAKDTINQLI